MRYKKIKNPHTSIQHGTTLTMRKVYIHNYVIKQLY